MAVPRCTTVTTWGIDDSRTWLDRWEISAPLAPHEPLLFDASLEPKPAYFAVRDALAAREGPFYQRARQLVASFRDARAAGDLRGTRRALRWTRRALVRARKTLKRERFRTGCPKLELVDWLLWLSVRGPAAADLADEVGTLREALDCDDRHFDRDPGAR